VPEELEKMGLAATTTAEEVQTEGGLQEPEGEGGLTEPPAEAEPKAPAATGPVAETSKVPAEAKPAAPVERKPIPMGYWIFLAIGMAVFSVLVFIKGLGVPLRILGTWFEN